MVGSDTHICDEKPIIIDPHIDAKPEGDCVGRTNA